MIKCPDVKNGERRKERKNRVGARAPASAFLECRRMSSLDRGETWLHKSRIHFKGLWSYPCLSLLGIYACTQFIGQSGIWNGTVVHRTKWDNTEQRSRRARDETRPSPFLLLREYYFRIYWNGTVSIPGDNASTGSYHLVSGLPYRDAYIFR